MKNKILLLSLIGILAISISGCKNDNEVNASTKQNTEQTAEDQSTTDTQTQETIAWTPLSQLTTYPELREKLNSLGIDISTNPTMQELMSNSQFIDAYFTNEDLQSQLNTIVAETYADLEPDDTTLQSIALNMYFDLLPDDTEGYFNGDSTLTRAQAMTILTRATVGAPDTGKPSDPSEDFTTAVGNNKYTPYAEYTDAYAFTSVANKTLDSTNFNTGITKAEYIYLVLNAMGELSADADTTTELTNIPKSSATTIAEALVTPEAGVPAPIYNAIAKAVELGLFTDTPDNGWDEVITKSEALDFLFQYEIALNAPVVTPAEEDSADAEEVDATETEQVKETKTEPTKTEPTKTETTKTETKKEDTKKDTSSSSDKKKSSSSSDKKSSSSSSSDKKSSSSDKKKSSSNSDKKKSSSSSDKKKSSSSSDKKSSSSDKKKSSSSDKKKSSSSSDKKKDTSKNDTPKSSDYDYLWDGEEDPGDHHVDLQ